MTMGKREIKFRAWTGEEMTRNLYWNDLDVNEQIDVLRENGWRIMQYTGLKDQNGKEIYEGDIVYDSLTKRKNMIQYFNGAFDAGLEWDDRRSWWEYCEVIGNKFENPELLGNDQ